MKIPKAITVGKTRFRLVKVRSLNRPPSYGRISYADNTITLATHSIHHEAYDRRGRATAFWHEAVHACLCDMDIPLRMHDEKFVDALAVRLAQICLTAEL